MKLAAKRNFDVQYYEKSETTWTVVSHLLDDPHDITLTLDVNMTEMIITNALIKFDKCPLEPCRKIQDNAKKLIGLKIDDKVILNAMKIFMGPYGCPNIMTLLNISIPGIIYYYYPYQIKIAKMTHEEFYNMIKTDLKDACLGHTLFNKAD